jgi:hypothetical protein
VSARLGVLGDGARARFGIDADGSVGHEQLHVTWWAGADDGWHDPATDTTTRFRRPGVAPTFETAVRVPSGDFVQRAYAVTAPSGRAAIAVDFENASRAPCSVAIFVSVRARGRLRLTRDVLWLDDERAITFGAPPRMWAATPNPQQSVRSGGATDAGPTEWDAPVQVALLAPVAHSTMLRTALSAEAVDLATLAGPAAVELGWLRLLDRGMRTELPETLQQTVDARRADLLLAPPSPSVVAALEDWGFDAEAEAGWSHLGFRARRVARRRPTVRGPWDAVPEPAALDDPGVYLLAVRQLLVHERRDAVDLLPGFRPEWLGQPLAVHDAPLRTGPISFAIRWHGARPALLWDAPPGLVLTVPALDPSWSTAARAGETLLAAPPAPLLAMGSSQRKGARIDDPESFG